MVEGMRTGASRCNTRAQDALHHPFLEGGYGKKRAVDSHVKTSTCGTREPASTAGPKCLGTTSPDVTPRNQGGQTTWDNIVIASLLATRRGRPYTGTGRMHLTSRPVRPVKLPDTYHLTFTWNKSMPESWKRFLTSVSYWTAELDRNTGGTPHQ